MGLSIEKKVGGFFLIALFTLGVFIELVEDWNPFIEQREYFTYFSSAVGIKLGDPVRIAGVEVGKVTSIGIEDSKVRIDFYVLDGNIVKTDSYAEIRQTNLLGGQFLGVTFGSADAEPLPYGSEISSLEKTNIDQLISNFDRNQERVFGTLGDILEKSEAPIVESAQRIESIVAKIDAGEGMLGRLVNDAALYEDLQFTVASLNQLLRRIESGEGTLGRLVSDPALYEETTATMANLRILTDSLRGGEGTLGKLFTDDALYADASDTLAELRGITRKINDGQGTLGKLVNEDSLYIEGEKTFANLSSITAKINEGQGTLGKLVNEDDLYRDTQSAVKKVEKAVDSMGDSGPISVLGTAVGTLF